MQRVVIEEFYRELDATNEDFVRRKHATGGYGGWKSKHVKQWLEAQDAKRAEQRAKSILRWNIIRALGGVGAAIIGGVAYWLK